MIKSTLLIFLVYLITFVQAQESYLRNAEKLFKNAEYDKTITLLNKVENKGEKHLFLEGKSYYKLKEYDKAIEKFESCVELNPKDAEHHYWLGAANIEALQGDDNFFKKGIYALNAQDALEKAIRLKPSHLEARTRLINYYINAPLIAGGSMSKAKEQANVLMKYDQNLGNQLMASIYLKNEEFDKAEEIYLNSLRLKEANKKVYYLLSEINLKRKNYERAFAYLDSSLKHYPEYKMSHYQYGKLAVLSGQNVKEGIAHLKEYLKENKDRNLPGKHWAFLRLGQLYKGQQRLEEARIAFKASIQEKSDFEKAKQELKSL